MKRESCENQEWARRCKRVRKLLEATGGVTAREGAASRMIRKPEDLPAKIGSGTIEGNW
jgi:hypothetical protein